MTSPSVPQPADLDVVRDSYDRVADNYVEMVATTGMGDVRTHPWLRAAMDVFADAVAGLGPVLDVGCGPGTVTAYQVAAAGGVLLDDRQLLDRHPSILTDLESVRKIASTNVDTGRHP